MPFPQILSNFPEKRELNCRDQLLSDLLDLVQEIAGANCCLLWKLAEKRAVQLHATVPSFGESETLLDLCRQIFEEHGNLFKQGQAIAFSQPQPFLLEPSPIRYLLFLPLPSEPSDLVALCLCHSCEPHWTEADISKLGTLVAQCAWLRREAETVAVANGNFLSQLTHELRTPLTSILGLAKMLQQELYGSLNPKQKQYVNGIVRAGEHLLALVNNFLDLSKIDANREELFLENASVEDICRASFALVEAKAQEANLSLKLKIEPGIGICYVDEELIKQILVNLLSNAIKFSENGQISLQVKQQEKLLSFAVTDTGIGIAASELDKLFQPFQQLNNPVNRQQKGTGLGLAISRKLARLHGGDITVTSQVGQGSCFTLQLPNRIDKINYD